MTDETPKTPEPDALPTPNEMRNVASSIFAITRELRTLHEDREHLSRVISAIEDPNERDALDYVRGLIVQQERQGLQQVIQGAAIMRGAVMAHAEAAKAAKAAAAKDGDA